ncbi:MAG: glycosyltransferase family 4 protein [Planctomycetes bacterium]|nr:glycosyltransferase family 4 protein [Planctomycetota bacterium]
MTTDTVGGVWTYALGLSAELCARGVEVLLVAAGDEPDAAQRADAAAIRGLELRAVGGRLEWMPAPWVDVDRTGERLLELAAAFEPDLVHLDDYSHGALPWPAPVVVVGHSCVASWFEAVRGHAPPPDWAEYRRRVRAGLAGADLVVAPTAAMLEALARHHGPLPRSRVIPNGARPERFPPGGKQPLIFSAGRLWDEAKNVAALVRVAPHLPWPVVVAGAPALDAGGAPVPLPGVRALGRIPQAEVAAWLGRASIYALPARYEPFGLSALEAALAGCALVLGDIPSLREVWGDAATFVAPDDDGALEAALRRLVGDPTFRRSAALAARARALALGAERAAARYLATYRELLGRELSHRARARAGRRVLRRA